MHLLAHLIWVHLQTEMTDFQPTLLYTRSLLLVGGAPRIGHYVPSGQNDRQFFFMWYR